MNLKDLEYFLSVAECGSFSKASAALGRPQPALSRHIRDLETVLQVQLLYRNGRGVVMTEAGQCLLEHGLDIIRRVHEARHLVQSYSSHAVRSATIGMPPSLSALLTARIAQTFTAENHGLQLRFVDAFNGDLLQGISAGNLDIAIIYDINTSPFHNAEPVMSQQLSLISVNSGTQRKTEATILASKLADYPLVLPSKRHGLRQVLESWAAKNAITLNVSLECDSYISLIQLVSSGMGSTILPASALRNEIMSDRLSAQAIVKPHLFRTMALTVSPNKAVSTSLIKGIKNKILELQDEFNWSEQLPANKQTPTRPSGQSPSRGEMLFKLIPEPRNHTANQSI